jgi:CDP-diacylglycerol--glycerol-3-phosphate 3-phosphatidyltransferase
MNGPTKLTIFRILLVPLLILYSFNDQPWAAWLSLTIFLGASLTDWLDGFLARRRNQVTMLGKLLDPLADKLLILTALCLLLEKSALPAWVVVVLIGREMAITGLRAFLAAERIILSAGSLGKWKMVFQVTGISFLFVFNLHPWFYFIGLIVIYLALLFSLISAFFYIRRFWAHLGDAIMAEQSLSQQEVMRGGSNEQKESMQ